MKAKKQTKNTNAHLEKIFTLAGLALIGVGCVTNLYSAYINRNFIHDPFDLIYYFRYVILLGGGFAAGYLLTKASNRYNRLFLGIAYAALAMAFYWLFEVVRGGLQSVAGAPLYPWGKVLFIGVPLLSLAATSATAYFTQYEPNRINLSTFTKAMLLVSLIVDQLYLLIGGIYLLLSGVMTYGPDTSVWSVVADYLTTPIVIGVVSYMFLGSIKKRFDRFFFAALAGTLYSTLTLVLWELRTDPSYDSTNVFSKLTTMVAVLFISTLLWQARSRSGRRTSLR